MKKHINYERICAFCENAKCVYDEDYMVCNDRGVVSKIFTCRKFMYDPLKRIPPRSVKAPNLDYIDIDAD